MSSQIALWAQKVSTRLKRNQSRRREWFLWARQTSQTAWKRCSKDLKRPRWTMDQADLQLQTAMKEEGRALPARSILTGRLSLQIRSRHLVIMRLICTIRQPSRLSARFQTRRTQCRVTIANQLDSSSVRVSWTILSGDRSSLDLSSRLTDWWSEVD